jgi:hypothetical protein
VRRIVLVVIYAGVLGTTAVAVDARTGGKCEWLAGDLHVHTTYSHDSYGGPADDNTGPDEAYTLGHPVASQFSIASARGLDFTAITDHNDVRSQSDPGFGSSGVIGVPGYENSLHGHAQMLGATQVYDNGDESAAAVQTLAATLQADGGVFQINHPALESTNFPEDPDWEYLYGVVPDTVEVWNISPLWKPPFPSGSTFDDALGYWEGWLDRGYRVGATGGSDNHWVSTTAVQGVGQPTTWVCANKATVPGILEGIRGGHTFISAQPPAHRGPLVFLEADAGNDREYEAIAGDSVPPKSVYRVRVDNAPGTFLRVVTTGGKEEFLVPITSAQFEHRFSLAGEVTWVRAEVLEPDAAEERAVTCVGPFGSSSTYCRDRMAVLGLTSAVYIGDGWTDS